jgi:hypothetical protein
MARMGIGKVFQDVRVFPSLTVEENVVAALMRREDRSLRNSLLRGRAALNWAREKAVGLAGQDRGGRSAGRTSWRVFLGESDAVGRCAFAGGRAPLCAAGRAGGRGVAKLGRTAEGIGAGTGVEGRGDGGADRARHGFRAGSDGCSGGAAGGEGFRPGDGGGGFREAGEHRTVSGTLNAMETNGTILEISGLTAGYNGREVLRGVDLRIGKDESIALIGPNGCGKSPLFRVGTGLLRPGGRRGEIPLRRPGREIAGQSDADGHRVSARASRARIGIRSGANKTSEFPLNPSRYVCWNKKETRL